MERWVVSKDGGCVYRAALGKIRRVLSIFYYST
jgi:hypothetical protein